ncbi:MAG: plasmid pRiA4b ORF-3 family protein [Deltaproteobacteria bacterium]|nr:plasmid pRiA4b ORF-3 family protein [Deltaproteobacteria bacterium]
MKPIRDTKTALLLEVSLTDVRPRAWRRLVVPQAARLSKLHHLLQLAAAWEDRHLHEFEVRGRRYSVPDPDDTHFDLDETKATLATLALRAGEKFQYVYDFGDDWRIECKVIGPAPEHPRGWAVCVAGENAFPPEDCGGPPGYEALLAAFASKPGPREDRDLADRRDWLGYPWDAEAFDRNALNRMLVDLGDVRQPESFVVRGAARARPKAHKRVKESPQDAAPPGPSSQPPSSNVVPLLPRKPK